MRRSALIVFGRPPVAGKVKTRLTSLLTTQEAADLYAAFLQDALTQYRTTNADVRLYLTEVHDLDFSLLGASCHLQIPGTLSVKMAAAFQETFALGYERVVIIGTDHPTLPDAYLLAAFEALSRAPAVVVGPTDDGGYYLLGMTRYYGELLHDMTFSKADVMTNTLRRARLTDACVVKLPAWYDVDNPSDLQHLSTSAQLPAYTNAVMRRLAHRYKL